MAGETDPPPYNPDHPAWEDVRQATRAMAVASRILLAKLGPGFSVLVLVRHEEGPADLVATWIDEDEAAELLILAGRQLRAARRARDN